MPVMDEFKEERAALKNGTPKQRLAYFWDYYKWYVIIGVIVIALVVSTLVQMVSRKETAFYALMLNSADYNYDEKTSYTDAFAEYAGIDQNEYEIIYDSSIQLDTDRPDENGSAQKLMVYTMAGELDVMLSDSDSLLRYAYQEDFYDLNEFLTTEQIAKYSDSFYYIDGAVVEAISAAADANEYDYVPEYGNPHHPEEMEKPIPAGIFLDKDCPLLQNYVFRGEEVVIGVMVNTSHPETASQFIDYLMQ